MTTGTTAFQLARIPVLLVLLRATGWYDEATAEALSRIQLRALWSPWSAVVLASLLAVMMMLVGRRQRHPLPILGAEAAIAAVLGVVPPLLWVIWFGVGGWFATLGRGFVQPLAVAWLGVVAWQAFYQLRDGDEARG